MVCRTCPSAGASPPLCITLFSTFASLQERKLQGLEVELEARVKDVKARLAQLDLQVRAWRGGQALWVPLTLQP